MNNFLPLDRKILNHWLWEDKPFSKGQAWIDLLLLANYKDKKKPIKDTVITYKRGSVNISMVQLAERWGWDRRKVKRFLDVLSDDGMVSVNSTAYGTAITIVNYEFFNNQCATYGTTNVQPMVQQVRTTNKDNKDEESKTEKKERIEEYDAPPLSPSPEEGDTDIKPKRKRSCQAEKHRYGEYKHVLLTDKERDNLFNKRGEAETLKAIKYLDEYIEMYGKTYNNHNLVLQKWVFDAVERDKKKRNSHEREENINASRQSQLDYLLKSIKEDEQNE